MSWCQQIHFCSLCHKWKLLIDWVSNIFFISYIDLKNVRNGARFRKEWGPSITNSLQYLTQHYTYVLVTFSRSLLHPLCCIPLLGLLLSLKFNWIIRLLAWALVQSPVWCWGWSLIAHIFTLSFSPNLPLCADIFLSLYILFFRGRRNAEQSSLWKWDPYRDGVVWNSYLLSWQNTSENNLVLIPVNFLREKDKSI